MAYKRRILRSAMYEYEAIVLYLAQRLKSPQAAAAFQDEFARQVHSVCENPQLHALSSMRELAARGYRTVPVGNYVMVYCVVDNWVFIAHVFHQSQDYARLV